MQFEKTTMPFYTRTFGTRRIRIREIALCAIGAHVVHVITSPPNPPPDPPSIIVGAIDLVHRYVAKDNKNDYHQTIYQRK
jgi:hypothetical protein